MDITVVTTNSDIARKVGNAFHALTGFSSYSQKKQKLFAISGEATEKVSRESLKRVAESCIRDDDVALIL